MRSILFGFLAFCVLSSKNILIFNEEILVCCTFFLFMVFSFRYFGNTIQESLNERSNLIKTELQDFCLLKIDSANVLLQEYANLSDLNNSLKKVATFTVNTRLGGSTPASQNGLKNLLANQIQQKLTSLSLAKASLPYQIHKSMASALLGTVLVESRGSKKMNMKQMIQKLKAQ